MKNENLKELEAQRHEELKIENALIALSRASASKYELMGRIKEKKLDLMRLENHYEAQCDIIKAQEIFLKENKIDY